MFNGKITIQLSKAFVIDKRTKNKYPLLPGNKKQDGDSLQYDLVYVVHNKNSKQVVDEDTAKELAEYAANAKVKWKAPTLYAQPKTK